MSSVKSERQAFVSGRSAIRLEISLDDAFMEELEDSADGLDLATEDFAETLVEMGYEKFVSDGRILF